VEALRLDASTRATSTRATQKGSLSSFLRRKRAGGTRKEQERVTQLQDIARVDPTRSSGSPNEWVRVIDVVIQR